MPAPAWMKYSLTSPFSNAKRSACTPIPKRWLTYDEADEKAYCRVNKIPYYKRQVPEYRAGPHPRSYKPTLPTYGIETIHLYGQRSAFE